MKRVAVRIPKYISIIHRRPRIQPLSARFCYDPLAAAEPLRPQTFPLTSKFFTAMADRPTLVKPPPVDPSKSAIENVLELTELSAIGPVGLSRKPLHFTYLFLSFRSPTFHMLTCISPGHVHQHQTPLAPPRSPRHLRRRRNRAMSRRSAAHRPAQFHSPQHALLFRSSRRQRDTCHVLRRARPRGEILCNTHSPSSAAREMYIHYYNEFCEGEQRREENGTTFCSHSTKFENAG